MSLSGLEPQDLAALPIFPLPNVVLFPGTPLPLHVFEPRYRALVKDVLAGRKLFAVARLKPGFEAEYEGRPPVFDVCGVGIISESIELRDGRFEINLQGLARVRILSELPEEFLYRRVRCVEVVDLLADPALTSAWQRKIGELWASLAPHLPASVKDLQALTRGAEGAGAYADRLAAALVGDAESSQRLLAEPDPAERLRLLVEKLEQVHDSILPSAPGRRSPLN